MRELLNVHNGEDFPAILYMTREDVDEHKKMFRHRGRVEKHSPSPGVDYRSIVYECRRTEVMLRNTELKDLQYRILELQEELDYRVDLEMEKLGNSIFDEFTNYVKNQKFVEPENVV